MQSAVRGVLGLGITLAVVAAAMASVNGLARGWAARKLSDNPDDVNAKAVMALF